MPTLAFAPSLFLGAAVFGAPAATSSSPLRPTMAQKEKASKPKPKPKKKAPAKRAAGPAPVAAGPVPCPAPTRPLRSQAGPARNAATFLRSQALDDGFPSSLQGLGAADAAISGTDAVRKLLGNAHVYESEWGGELGQIAARKDMSGDMRECVREVAMSAAFKERFLEKAGSVRFVEVCFKILLGRGPVDKTEVSEKIQMLADGDVSYGEFVDSFVGSREYDDRFGKVLLPEFVAPGGLYGRGMVGFMSNMRVLATTRGGNCDVTPSGSLSFPVVAGGEPAAAEFVSASYPVPKYEAFKIQLLTKSVLDKDYASSLHLSKAAVNWCGSVQRPHGPENGVWEDGWKPVPMNSWKAGWAPAGKKYV